jgi:hypothetical protein
VWVGEDRVLSNHGFFHEILNDQLRSPTKFHLRISLHTQIIGMHRVVLNSAHTGDFEGASRVGVTAGVT